jgi:hypothetical protein
MRHATPALAALALGAMTMASAAQAQGALAQRHDQLEHRIDQGARNGQLTRSEQTRMRQELDRIARTEARDRAGGLSRSERAELDRRYDRLSRQINGQRHDDQTAWFGAAGWRNRAGMWIPVNRRQAELDRRIDRGVRNGGLTTAEAGRLRRQYHAIARLETRYRRNGLSPSERADLDRRFDRLAQHIHAQRTDDQREYGYGYGHH